MRSSDRVSTEMPKRKFSRCSRDGESDKLVEKIETLMDDTTNGGDREKIRNQIMEVMNKYK